MGRNRLGYVSEDPTTSVVYVNGTQTGYGVATGGTSSSITVGGENYTLLTFTSTGTLTVSTAGLFDVLAISAGTAGIGSHAGAGGSGVVVTTTAYFSANQTVTVGAGGSGAGLNYDALRIGNYSGVGTSSVSNGVLTSSAMCKVDGSATCVDLSNGGGAGSGHNANRISTAPENYTGFRGGNGVTNAQGGGGGYSSRGADGSGSTGGAGGAGYDVSAFIGGSALYKAAGGGGAGTGSGGAGGSGVGGAGGSGGGNGSNAGANTGSGGGGSNFATPGQGGSGIVYVRFKV